VSYDSGREDPPSASANRRQGCCCELHAELDLDLTRSWMVGDRWRDVDCGRAPAADCLIDGGYSEGLRTNPISPPGSFADAVIFILRKRKTPDSVTAP